MCAYLTTPLLQRLRKHANWVLPCLLALILICYVGAPSLKYVFVLSWFYLYAIGYLFVNLSANWKKIYLALFTVGLIVILSKIDVRSFSNSYSTIYRAIHDIVGVFVVVVGVWCLSKIKNIKVPGAITMFDKYSYYIFLVHFTIMHGPFSMAYITPYIGLNILIMLLSTTVATFLFVKILNFVESIIGKTEEKYINSKQR